MRANLLQQWTFKKIGKKRGKDSPGCFNSGRENILTHEGTSYSGTKGVTGPFSSQVLEGVMI